MAAKTATKTDNLPDPNVARNVDLIATALEGRYKASDVKRLSYAVIGCADPTDPTAHVAVASELRAVGSGYKRDPSATSADMIAAVAGNLHVNGATVARGKVLCYAAHVGGVGVDTVIQPYQPIATMIETCNAVHSERSAASRARILR